MEAIQIDFDVYKALTMRRTTASVTYNDVLRDVLGLPAVSAQPAAAPSPVGRAWIAKGVTFPHGTQFKARYKGREYEAEVRDGALIYNGEAFKSPSAAAIAITGNSVNGWKFWEARLPRSNRWALIFSLWQQQGQHK